MLPSAVLARFGPVLAGLQWHPVSRPGFSDAVVRRGDDSAGNPRVALKGSPASSVTVERLTLLHSWLRLASDLPFLPQAITTRDGSTVVLAEGRLWEATTWQPGTADFHANPSRQRLDAVCTAMARLHQRWAAVPAGPGPMPGIARRLRILADASNASPAVNVRESRLSELLRRGRDELARHRPAATKALERWATISFPLQPCLCDPWHDHVLFTGDEVTGIIDHGAMRVDHVAVDLARLLGSLVPNDTASFAIGLKAYRDAGGRLDVPDEFVMLLAQTGRLGAVAGWIVRIDAAGGVVANPSAVADRIEELLGNLDAGDVPFRLGASLQ